MKHRVIHLSITLGLGLGLALALLWAVSSGTRAQGPDGIATYYVAPGGSCGGQTPCFASVQAAVDATDDADDVIKVAAGTYTDVSTHAGITQVVIISKTVTIRGGYTSTDWNTFDPVANPTTLDAQGLGRVMVISDATAFTAEGLHITGGDATGLGGDGYHDAGGGMYIQAATVVLSNCVVYSNTASTTVRGYGGGVYVSGGSITFYGNTFAHNTAGIGVDGRGGGLYLAGSGITLQNNTIVSNTASTTNDGNGGGVSLSGGSGTLHNNTIVGNVASKGYLGYGGGLGIFSYEHYTLTDNTILNNIASTASNGYGGGLRLNSDAALFGNTFVHNTASTANDGYGGGLDLWGSDFTLHNNVIVSNTASTASNGRGGGLHIDGGTAILSGNTIQENTASTTNRGYGGGAWVAADATLTGNLIADNTASMGYIGYGGGLNVRDRNVMLQNNAIARNTATTTSDGGYGGGVYLYHGSPTLDGNSILSNTASSVGTGYGGGLYAIYTSPCTLTNNLIVGNRANTQGSGLWHGVGPFPPGPASGILRHNTIASNLSSGQGIFAGNQTSLALTNTIIIDHSAYGVYASSGSTITLEATLWGSGVWANAADWGGAGSITTGTLNLYQEPAFVAPGSDDYHLADNSPAIDYGVATGVTTDLDGYPRPIGLPDLGSYEWARRTYLPLALRNW